MNDMSDDGWQESQHADETRLQADMLNALTAALVRPLTQDEAMLLAWGSGCANDFNKEIRK